MRRPLRPAVRRLIPAIALLVALPSGGCKDQRGDPAGPDPGFLDGDALFGSALVSAEIFRTINHFAEAALDLYERGAVLPVSEPACLGDGIARITDNGDTDPATLAVTFTNHVVECDELPLTLNTDPAVSGKMIFTFLETSPGLVFEVRLPIVGPQPRGIVVELPPEAGALSLAMTTPYGALRYELDGPRTGRDEGTMHVTGTIRLEDRNRPLLIVEELRLTYTFADGLIPKMARWPGGSYEIAAFGAAPGGFAFGGPVSGFPVDVFFDGLGGAAFPLGDRTCVANLATGENPCEDL